MQKICENSFIIKKQDRYLNVDITAFYSKDYHRMRDHNQSYYINIIKNDDLRMSESELNCAVKKLEKLLSQDLPKIYYTLNEKLILEEEIKPLTACVVPRAERKSSYKEEQLLFSKTVQKVVKRLDNFFIDGCDYIVRNIDTATTHRRRNHCKLDDKLKAPYPGITCETCDISDNVKNKNILLIDDVYTKRKYVAEDAIQALLDKGAKSVYFYAVFAYNLF